MPTDRLAAMISTFAELHDVPESEVREWAVAFYRMGREDKRGEIRAPVDPPEVAFVKMSQWLDEVAAKAMEGMR
jgi:hypothetical protein